MPRAAHSSSTASGASTSAWVNLASIAAAACDVEEVLHGDDGRARQRRLDLPGVDVAQRQVADLALGLQRHERVERLQEGHARAGHVAQVHHVEPLEAQRAQIVLGAVAQLLGAGSGRPALVGEPLAAELAWR